MPMELPARGTVRGSGTCCLMKSRVAAPASSSVTVELSMAASRPLLVCILRTTSSIPPRTSGGWWITRSGPSATTWRSSSVTRVAISTMAWRAGSSPVISRSIQTSIGGRAYARRSMPLTVPVVRLDPELPLPSYARLGDAGADLVARVEHVLAAGGGRALIPTGIDIALPAGYAGVVVPRNGLAFRHGVTCLNTPGLIDCGYRDELK